MTDENNKKNTPASQENQPPKSLSFFIATVLLIVSLVAAVFCGIACIGATYPNLPWGDILVTCAVIGLLTAFWISAYSKGYQRGVNTVVEYEDEE